MQMYRGFGLQRVASRAPDGRLASRTLHHPASRWGGSSRKVPDSKVEELPVRQSHAECPKFPVKDELYGIPR